MMISTFFFFASHQKKKNRSPISHVSVDLSAFSSFFWRPSAMFALWRICETAAVSLGAIYTGPSNLNGRGDPASYWAGGLIRLIYDL